MKGINEEYNREYFQIQYRWEMLGTERLKLRVCGALHSKGRFHMPRLQACQPMIIAAKGGTVETELVTPIFHHRSRNY
jgi:hypothetical protein